MKQSKTFLSAIDAYIKYKPNISKKEYRKLIRGFGEFIVDELLNGKEIILPENTGKFEIVGKKIKPIFADGNLYGLSPNWPGTKKLWDSNPEAKKKKTILYHFNEHSNGIRYKVKWSKPITGSYNKMLYTFRTARGFKRRLWKKICDGFEYRLIYEKQYQKDRFDELKLLSQKK